MIFITGNRYRYWCRTESISDPHSFTIRLVSRHICRCRVSSWFRDTMASRHDAAKCRPFMLFAPNRLLSIFLILVHTEIVTFVFVAVVICGGEFRLILWDNLLKNGIYESFISVIKAKLNCWNVQERGRLIWWSILEL